MSEKNDINEGLLKSWFLFPEVKQNWFGYSRVGNTGSGLGLKFAKALSENLNTIFNNFGKEKVSSGSHLEKLCLIKEGVGRDNISDFTTNLIKGFLLEYTEQFARQYIKPEYCARYNIGHVEFNYETRTWMRREFLLPTKDNDFVLLTPKEILTKDDTWINKTDMVGNFQNIASSIPNDQLRAQINDYLPRVLPDNPSKKEYMQGIIKAINKFPSYIDYYIKYKEDTGDEATQISHIKVKETEELFNQKVNQFVVRLANETDFYNTESNSYNATYQRVLFLKQVIENNDGYKIFYLKNKPIKREQDLQLLFRLTFFATSYDVNSEVNNGRGPVDYKISKGSEDKTLVEFKLASNSKLKQNLKNQVKVYEAANQTKSSIKVVLYFTDNELEKLIKIMKALGLNEGDNLVIIDARPNKESASNVKL